MGATFEVKGYAIRLTDEKVLIELVGPGVLLALEPDKVRHLANNLLRACDLYDSTHGKVPNQFIKLPFQGVSEVKRLGKINARVVSRAKRAVP